MAELTITLRRHPQTGKPAQAEYPLFGGNHANGQDA